MSERKFVRLDECPPGLFRTANGYLGYRNEYASIAKDDNGEFSHVEAYCDILADLRDRQGLKHEWDRIDEDTQREIKAQWAAITHRHLQDWILGNPFREDPDHD